MHTQTSAATHENTRVQIISAMSTSHAHPSSLTSRLQPQLLAHVLSMLSAHHIIATRLVSHACHAATCLAGCWQHAHLILGEHHACFPLTHIIASLRDTSVRHLIVTRDYVESEPVLCADGTSTSTSTSASTSASASTSTSISTSTTTSTSTSTSTSASMNRLVALRAARAARVRWQTPSIPMHTILQLLLPLASTLHTCVLTWPDSTTYAPDKGTRAALATLLHHATQLRELHVMETSCPPFDVTDQLCDARVLCHLRSPHMHTIGIRQINSNLAALEGICASDTTRASLHTLSFLESLRDSLHGDAVSLLLQQLPMLHTLITSLFDARLTLPSHVTTVV